MLTKNFPGVRVVLDKTFDKENKVSIIAGGGAGHEPAYAGLVGKGMLTGSVVGDVFASPTTDAVLEAIRATTGPKGCLLIVMNYTGDRLNFGLAAEIAKSEGYKVDLLVTQEDVALESLAGAGGIIGRRGLAATTIGCKVAGAASDAGLSLEEVHSITGKTMESVATMGVALTACNLPGNKPTERLLGDDMEIGLGIHGEPGLEQTNLKSS